MMIGKSKYPTAEEIMNPAVSYKDDTLAEMMAWKTKFFPNWNTKPKEEQLEALKALILKLCGVYGEEVIVDKNGDSYCFIPGENTICLDKNNPSIISTLHEFRHKINGADETSACRWSVQLFKRCFPRSFEKLEFKKGSHLLIRKTHE
jgi:hypothetical protein